MPKDHIPGTKVKPDPVAVSGIEDRIYTTREVAEMFELSEHRVRLLVRSGELHATKGTTKQGHRFSREALVAFAIKRYQS